jgi:hypothetical protein
MTSFPRVLACLAWAVLAGACGSSPDGAQAGAATDPDAAITAADALVEVDAAAEPAHVVLAIDYEVQETGYWCGPAATRHALSARIAPPSQATLASQLPTTTNGTDWIGQVTAVLNDYLGAGRYRTVEMPDDPPSVPLRERLWADVTYSLAHGYVVVANIVAPPTNHPPGYPSDETIYHYFAVTGYDRDAKTVYIADSAAFSQHQYWLSFDQLATLIPPKGYSTLAAP